MSYRDSVALVVLDTLRKDTFDDFFRWIPGAHFENTWSTSHWTVPVHASLFGGKYPSELGVHSQNQTLDCPEAVVPELLEEDGYMTRSFSCNINVSPAFDFDRGFRQFDGSWRLQNVTGNTFDWEEFISRTDSSNIGRYFTGLRECMGDEYDTWKSLKRGALIKLRDLGFVTHPDEGAKEALEYVTKTDFGTEEFLFMNLMETHAPYTPPREYRTVTTERPLDEVTATNGFVSTVSEEGDPHSDVLLDAYNDCARYLSDIYKEIFDELRKSFDIIITVSDHGELFGEHGAWKHAYGLYPELTHVPLVVSGDEIPDQECNETVSLLDVHQTILTIAEIEAESEGNTLLEEERSTNRFEVKPTDERCFTEYHGLYPRHRAKAKAAGYDSSLYEAELFGCAVSSSYACQTEGDLFISGEIQEDTVAKTIAEHENRIEKRDVGNDMAVSDAVERQLEDLGYA